MFRNSIFRENIFHLLILFIFLVALQYDFVVSKRIMFTHDAIEWYGGMYFYYDSILNGYFPFWNPFSHAGEPYYLTPHVNNALCFLTLVMIMVAKVIKLSLIDLYHYCSFIYLYIFGIGSYYFYRDIILKKEKYSGFCALFAAIAIISGLTSTTYRQPAFLFIACLAPWYSYFFIKMLKSFENNNAKDSKKYSFYFIVIFGMGIFTHIPLYSIFYISVLFLILIVFRYISFKKFVSHLFLIAKSNCLYFLLISIVFILIVSPSLFLFMDFSGVDIIHESRAEQRGLHEKFISYNTVQGAYSNYFDYLGLLYPMFFHMFFAFGEKYASEATQYIGIIPIFLAIVAISSSSNKNRFIRPFFVMFIILGGLMLGKHFVFYYAVFHIFPLFKTIIEMHQFLGFYVFVLGSLSAIGCNILINNFGFQKSFFVFLVMTLCYIIFSFAISSILNNYKLPQLIVPSVKMTIPPLLILIAILFLFSKVSFSKSRLCLCYILLSLTFVELYIYNTKHLIPQLEGCTYLPFRTYIVGNQKTENPFQYWRRPMLGDGFWPFRNGSDILFKARTFSSRFGSHITMSKRYNELFKLLPIENLKIISGISKPVLRFYSNAYIADKPGTVLELIASQPPDVLDKTLFLENNNIPDAAKELAVSGELFNASFKTSEDINKFKDPIFRMSFYDKQLSITSKDNDIPNINEQPDFVEFVKHTPLTIDNYGMFLIGDTDRDKVSDFGSQNDKFTFYGNTTFDNNKIRINKSNGMVNADFFYYSRDFDEYEKLKQMIKVVDFNPNKLTLEVFTNDNGFLYYSDGWHKYWQAFIDEKQVPVLCANYNYKAVFLEKGKHLVCFSFNPHWYKYSLYLSLSLINCFIVFVSFLFIKNKIKCLCT